MPLLHIRPDGFVREGSHAQGEEWNRGTAAAAKICVSCNVELRCVENEWRRALEGFGVAFIAVRVLEENTIAAPNGHFTVTLWIKGKTHTRPGIKAAPL